MCLLVVNRVACGVLPRAASRGRPNDAVHNLKERKNVRLFMQGDTMRFAIIVTLTAAATLATVRSGSAQNDQREAPRSPATRDAATGSVPDLITPDQEGKIPYHACINARGWVNGRLVCSESYSTGRRSAH